MIILVTKCYLNALGTVGGRRPCVSTERSGARKRRRSEFAKQTR